MIITTTIDIMNSTRDNIFSRIKQANHQCVSLPEIPHWEISGEPEANFISKLESFDGKAISFPSREAAIKWLKETIVTDEVITFSALPELTGNLTAEAVADPHAAHVIDVCIGEGELGVGETGSIWLTDDSVGKAACALLSTDLYLLLDRHKIVAGLQDAYSTLNLRNRPYGSFFTGPSATADIEAVRVTGAQGEISLTALLYG